MALTKQQQHNNYSYGFHQANEHISSNNVAARQKNSATPLVYYHVFSCSITKVVPGFMASLSFLDYIFINLICRDAKSSCSFMYE